MQMDSRCESDAADSYPDETLVEGWLNGDGDAIEKLVTRYMPLVMNYLLRRVDHPQDAEDLAQEVWIGVHTQLHRLRRRDRFVIWLLRIARSRVVDFLRGQRGPRPVKVGGEELIEQAIDPTPGPDQRVQGIQVRGRVLKAISRLKDRLQVVCYLQLIEELPSSEIARRLGLKESTVRMRLHRGLRRLRRLLEREGMSE